MSLAEQLERGERAERQRQVMLALERSLRLENASLRAALKPFADIADLVNHTERRDGERVFELPNPAGGYFTLVREDFRRAFKAFNGTED